MIDEQIRNLRPYFHSIKEAKGQAALYILIPAKWKFSMNDSENIHVKQQDGNETQNLVSIISKIRTGEDTYENIFNTAKSIIKYNVEQEEKEKLFKEKMDELKEIFMNADLDKLKHIKFTNDDRQIEVAGVGNGEGQQGDSEPQEEADTGDKESE